MDSPDAVKLATEEGKELPDSFDAENFDLVAKEMWLMGYWAEQVNPGLINVYKESSEPKSQPVGVASYHKGWYETKWRREGRPHRVCYADSGGMFTSRPTTTSPIVREEK